ncbi:MAG: hypothetical protein H0U74_17575 [Bradymonadaceae bacterium]|nr:hypothetical protein [Lujinxingiaceae bacterium]
MSKMITIAELGPFRKHSSELMADEEVETFKDFIARQPEAKAERNAMRNLVDVLKAYGAEE